MRVLGYGRHPQSWPLKCTSWSRNYQQMRILEFPRYETFAQSFPNTVPFSEGIGFLMDIDDENESVAEIVEKL